jgi:hypothetical protein
MDGSESLQLWFSHQPSMEEKGLLTIGQFLHAVDLKAVEYSWSETETKCQTLKRLQGTSQDWVNVNMCGLVEAISWTDVKCRLIEQFRRKLNIREKVELRKGLRQSKDETSIEFLDRCKMSQFLICDENSAFVHDRDILLNFLLGLHEEILKAVIQTDASSLDAFLNEAMRIEAENLFLKVENLDHSNDSNHLEPTFINEFILDDDMLTLDNMVIEETKTAADDDDDEFKCQFCGCSYAMEKNLIFHIGREHSLEDSKVKCHICSVSFHSMRMYTLHMQNMHHETCFTCELCPRRNFFSDMKLAIHKCFKHGERDGSQYLCSFCRKPYQSQRALTSHIKAEHFNYKPYACNVCNASFVEQHSLKTHVRLTHLLERPFECNECDRRFASSRKLSDHKCAKHGKGLRLECPECDKTFAYKTLLRNHILTNHKRGSFICDECGKLHNTEKSLRDHIKTHEGLKSVACTFEGCTSMFTRIELMRSHLKSVHVGKERKFSCSYCPKKFLAPALLKRHEDGVHLNKKGHKCPHCEFASAYKGHIRDHVRATHEAVKFPCPYPLCNHQSSYKGNLDKHMKNVHARPLPSQQ